MDAGHLERNRDVAGLGLALTHLPLTDLSVPPVEVWEQARSAVETAYELDPASGEVRAAMAAYLHFLEWDLLAAERHDVEALRWIPGDEPVRQWYASLLPALGPIEEGVEQTRRILPGPPRCSPRS